MAIRKTASELLFADQLVDESNQALQRGALIALIFTGVGAVLLVTLMATGLAHDLLPPMALIVVAGGLCSLLYVLARARRMHGPVAYAVLLSFVSLPTAFFFAVHGFMPAGAATFITGPVSYLYAILIVLTGFVLDARLSALSGVVAAAGYLAAALVALPTMRGILVSDPALAQNLQTAPIYAIRALMLLFVGLGTGALARMAKRLTLRVLLEEREKAAVSRLFGEYVSEEVKDKLLEDPSASRGERKEVAVLFADIRSFTSYSESAEPEEIVRRLNEYFDEMVAAIAVHRGVIDKFVGDAVMAVFGGIVSLDNPSAAAVKAAREMRRRLAQLNRRWQEQGLEPFQAGIGIHHGEVLQGAVGSAARKDFTVIGDVVNTASRVEAFAKQFDANVVVTAELQSRLPPDVQAQCRPLGSFPVKGRSAEIALFGIADDPPE